MFSEKDFERLWFFYKTEGELKGVSFIDYFCKLLKELKKGRTDY